MDEGEFCYWHMHYFQGERHRIVDSYADISVTHWDGMVHIHPPQAVSQDITGFPGVRHNNLENIFPAALLFVLGWEPPRPCPRLLGSLQVRVASLQPGLCRPQRHLLH